MTNNQLKKLADRYGLDLKYITKWDPPKGEDLRPLIAMPNLPKMTHGLSPRTLLGSSTWNHMRKSCYAKANDICEICGDKPEILRRRHCLERGTEVLTDRGWKTIEQITTDDTVAGFYPDTETIVWEHPTSTTSHFEKNIYRFEYKSNKGFSMGVSDGHRMLLQNGRNKKYETVVAKDMKVGVWKNIPASGHGEGEDALSMEERLFIALQADGATEQLKNGEYYCRIRVKKKRKQKRLAWIVKNVSIPIRELSNPNPGYYGVSFTIPFNGKRFIDAFNTTKMSYQKALDFIDELVKWDGWEGDRNGCHGRCYYSSNREDIDFVQAVCAQAGLGSHLTVSDRATRDWGQWHLNKNKASTNVKPSYNLEIKKRAFYGVQTMNKCLEDYNDEVFCISVPSTYFVARTKGGDVFITGNCHEAYSIDYEKGLVTFVRCFCLDSVCHLACIHNGRAYTLWKDKHPLYPTNFLLEGAERAFRIIASYNKDHLDADLRAYSTYIEYLKHEELRDAMLDLIAKHHIKFCMEDPKKMAPWKSWKLIIGNQEYPTPYENEKAWKKAMEEAGKKDTARIMQKNMEEKFSGGIYDEVNKIIKEA